MSVIKIDGKDYDSDSLSEAVKTQIGNLQAVDRRLQDLREQLAITQTARLGYAAALKAALESPDGEAADSLAQSIEVTSQ